jgi:hypothetical protein
MVTDTCRLRRAASPTGGVVMPATSQEVKQRRNARSAIYRKRPEVQAREAAYRAANREKLRAGGRDHYAKNREKLIAYAKEYDDSHRQQIRFARIRRRYGMNEEQFVAMMERQGNACAICRSKSWGSHGPCIDHDHGSGIVRGLLCDDCNVLLGRAKDSASILRASIHYLETKRLWWPEAPIESL